MTSLGEVTSGGTVTPPGSGGTLVIAFGRSASAQGTLADVTYAGSAATSIAFRATSRRAGAAIYTAPAGSGGTLTWTGEYRAYVYHVDATLTNTATANSSPTTASWSLALTGASSGDLVFVAVGLYGITDIDTTLTSPMGIDGVIVPHSTGSHTHGHGLADATNFAPAGVIDPVQTNSAYTAVAAAAFSAA